MCTGTEAVHQEAQPLLAAILGEMALAVCNGDEREAALVKIGPVDFGHNPYLSDCGCQSCEQSRSRKVRQIQRPKKRRGGSY